MSSHVLVRNAWQELVAPGRWFPCQDFSFPCVRDDHVLCDWGVMTCVRDDDDVDHHLCPRWRGQPLACRRNCSAFLVRICCQCTQIQGWGRTHSQSRTLSDIEELETKCYFDIEFDLHLLFRLVLDSSLHVVVLEIGSCIGASRNLHVQWPFSGIGGHGQLFPRRGHERC